MNELNSKLNKLDAEVENYLQQKVPVLLYHNNELGWKDWVWAVVVESSPDFWLIAFDTKGEAVRYCKQHGLPYREKGKDE